eukprot:10821521-Lingulodinium_polyedra.AAC.1
MARLETDVKEEELLYRVVRCSSQLRERPAADLIWPSGRWESAGHRTHNEFVVLELCSQAPRCVTGLSMVLPGTDAGPRRCQVHYSENSPKGSWREAWRFDFEVCSKEDTAFQTRHDYDAPTRADDFKE